MRAIADAYAEAVLVGMPPRWRRGLLNAGAVAALVAALVSLNAMGALFNGEELPGEGPLIAAPGPLDLPQSLPALPGADDDGSDTGDGGGGGASQAGDDAGGDAADPSRGTGGPAVVGRLVDRELRPGRIVAPSPPDQEIVTSLESETAPAAQDAPVQVASVTPDVRVESPAADPPGTGPAPTPPPTVRGTLRLQVLSIERTSSRLSGDRLDVTLSATHEDSDEPAHVMAMQVAMPEVGRRSVDGQESLRLELAMLDQEDAEDDENLALRVRVSLTDTDVNETTVSRTEADAGAASDTLHLLVPLAAPLAPPVPVPVPEPPTEAPEPPPSVDTTIPVDVLVPVTPEAEPPQTVELPSATPATGAAPEVTVGLTPAPAPPAPPAEPDPAPEPEPAVDPPADVPPVGPPAEPAPPR